MYIALEPTAKIKLETNIGRQKVHWFFQKALEEYTDGRIVGFRVCIPYFRSKDYEREATPRKFGDRYGHAGMLKALLRQHPEIEKELRNLIFKGVPGKLYETRITNVTLHRVFLKRCTAAGIKRNEFPFSVRWRANRSLANLRKQWVDENLARYTAITSGPHIARKIGSGVSASKYTPAVFHRVEFDGHKIDALFVVTITLPDGRTEVLVLERLWILVARECRTGAILGYYVPFHTEYRGEDVLTAFENAVIPWKPKELTIEGLSYPEDGGFPSGVIPECAYALWNFVGFDNARSHGRNIESWVWQRICDGLGCKINPGPVGEPDQRLIENFFGIMARYGFQRLPNTTGREPNDPSRKNPEKAAIKYHISAEEILEVIDVLLADYNGRPNRRLAGKSPLEALRFGLAEQGNDVLVEHLAEDKREDFCLCWYARKCKIVGKVEAGHRLHINFLGVEYSSPKLAADGAMRGLYLKAIVKTKNIRTLRVYLSSGEFFDELVALGGWGLSPHDESIRRAILRLQNEGKLRLLERDDPVRAYIEYLDQKAVKKKRARNQGAHARRVIAQGGKSKAIIDPPHRPRRIRPRKAPPPLQSSLGTLVS